MDRIEQARGDLLLPLALRGAGGPYIYNPLNPEALEVVAFHPDYPAWSLAGYSVVPVSAYGEACLLIPGASLPTLVENFFIYAYSPTGAFYTQIFEVVFFPTTVRTQVSALAASLGEFRVDFDAFEATVIQQLGLLLVPTEANVEKTFEWNVDGTEIQAVNIRLVTDDNAPNFDNPDKKYRIEYFRDETSRRVTRATIKEVAV
ncbi:MAG: hypothetical protein P1V51_20055 [Deltaproteobacteria bacterium]|nr:hypothetical protein [Deltaproteobacteria bacterium]